MKTVPDIILYNGNIKTQDNCYPMAQALAISGNQILSLGSDRKILNLASKM